MVATCTLWGVGTSTSSKGGTHSPFPLPLTQTRLMDQKLNYDAHLARHIGIKLFLLVYFCPLLGLTGAYPVGVLRVLELSTPIRETVSVVVID